tara:strand:+ start:4686 stop:5036 length:351 start_codon:yes stop_codon:yes gene_type:complete
MPNEPAVPVLRDAIKKRQTRCEVLLSEMEGVVHWGWLLGLITPHYPKAGPEDARLSMPIEAMLRVYFLQIWYALSNPTAEEMLCENEAMRRFAGIEPGDDRIPPLGDALHHLPGNG